MRRSGLRHAILRNPWRTALVLGVVTIGLAATLGTLSLKRDVGQLPVSFQPSSVSPPPVESAPAAPAPLPSLALAPPSASPPSVVAALSAPDALPPPAPAPQPVSPPAAAPAAPTAPNPANRLHTQIENAVRDLSNGHVAFNHPMRSNVGRTEIIQAELSRKLSADDLSKFITAPGEVEKHDIKVGAEMQATLNGGGAFDVTPSGPQSHWISDDAPTSWTWTVTPKLTGIQYLILAIDAIITIDGKSDTYPITTLREPIQIEVGWPQTFGEWLEYGKKTADDIGWLWAPIAGGVVLVIGWWRKPNKHDFS